MWKNCGCVLPYVRWSHCTRRYELWSRSEKPTRTKAALRCARAGRKCRFNSKRKWIMMRRIKRMEESLRVGDVPLLKHFFGAIQDRNTWCMPWIATSCFVHVGSDKKSHMPGIGGNNSIHFLANQWFSQNLYSQIILGKGMVELQLHEVWEVPIVIADSTRSTKWPQEFSVRWYTYRILIELIVAQPRNFAEGQLQRNFELVTQPFSSVSEAE